MALVTLTPGMTGIRHDAPANTKPASAAGSMARNQQSKGMFDGMGIDNLMGTGVLELHRRTRTPSQEMTVQTSGISAESNANGILTT